MREEAKAWHMDVLDAHQSSLYENLVYPHHVTSTTLKEIGFENSKDTKPIRGYFAYKENSQGKVKYFVDEIVYPLLPVRMYGEKEELLLKKSSNENEVIFRYLSPIPFKIRAKDTMTARQLVDGFVPFLHSNPRQWMLLKFVGVASYIGQTFICICSESEFGKSSIFEVTNSITNRVPVYQPRSIPGVLIHLDGQGNIVWDEAHKCDKAIRDIMEQVSLQLGGGKKTYINGATKSSITKERYSCTNQSLTYLFNPLEYYSEPKKQFFDFMFANNEAMETRFLKLRLKGKLVEKFDKDFDIIGTSKANLDYYLSFAKKLMHLAEIKRTGGYIRRWNTNTLLEIKGRRKQVFDEVTWIMDMYSDNQTEYDDWVQELEKAIMDYKEMMKMGEDNIKIEEEVI